MSRDHKKRVKRARRKAYLKRAKVRKRTKKA